MSEEVQLYLDEAVEIMDKAIKFYVAELVKIRAGRAMPNMLDGLTIEYYGSPTPISQVASISTADARTLAIKPFERNLINEIEKSIRNSQLGINPQNNGEQILLVVPPMTEERRRDLAKSIKANSETAKIAVRNIRKDTNESLKKLLKEGISEDEIKISEEKVQKLTDKYIADIEQITAKKEVEIMTV